MADTSDKAPIYVIRKKASNGGHHGGAWKVAYADFVTAMMSLFIVLWLLNSTPQVKKAIAGYFNDPSGTGTSSGSTAAGTDQSVSIDKTSVEKLKEEIEKAILDQPDLKKLSRQIDITIVGEGLKIELLEAGGKGTFFDSGSATLSPEGIELLATLALQLKALPNALSIEGHTDSTPYSGNGDYSNWELSTDRANSARRLLQQNGVRPNQITQVRGYADQQLRKPAAPLDPSNRRISMIVGWVRSPEAPPADTGEAPKPEKAGAKPAPGKPAPAVKDPDAAPAKVPLMDRLRTALPGKKAGTP